MKPKVKVMIKSRMKRVLKPSPRSNLQIRCEAKSNSAKF